MYVYYYRTYEKAVSGGGWHDLHYALEKNFEFGVGPPILAISALHQDHPIL